MADRIQLRRDTKSEWESINPVLLEGEVGIVLDDPNLYKVGDGNSTWNFLPYRGFNGNLVEEEGDATNTTLNQKGITEALNKRDIKIALLETDAEVIHELAKVANYEVFRQYKNIINEVGEVCLSKFTSSMGLSGQLIRPYMNVDTVCIRLDRYGYEGALSSLKATNKYVTYIHDTYLNATNDLNNYVGYLDTNVVNYFGCNFGSYRYAFTGASNLEYVEIINLRSSINLIGCPKLSTDWITDFISNLPTTTEGYSITLNVATRNKMTLPQVNSIIAKGWNLL